jgi:hypothetical protein
VAYFSTFSFFFIHSLHFRVMAVEDLQQDPTAAPRQVPKKQNYTVHPAPDAQDAPGFFQFNRNAMFACMTLSPLLVSYVTGATLSVLSYTVLFAVLLLPTYVVYMVTDSALKNWAFTSSQQNVCGAFPFLP